MTHARDVTSQARRRLRPRPAWHRRPRHHPDAQRVWDGLLARGDLTLLTSVWKSGKTTLFAGLLDALNAGRPFLGLDTIEARTVVLSQEAPVHWAERQAIISGGHRARLVSRPLPKMPSLPTETHSSPPRPTGPPLRSTCSSWTHSPHSSPISNESHTGTLLNFLRPLRRLAAGGTAVVILHHPPKKNAEAGSRARGGGALLGYVDVLAELGGCGRLASDANRRRLTVRSRHPSAPVLVVYE